MFSSTAEDWNHPKHNSSSTPNFVSGGCSVLQETGSFTLLYDEVSQQQERLRLKREAEKLQEDRPRWSTWGSSPAKGGGMRDKGLAKGGGMARRAFSARSSFRH